MTGRMELVTAPLEDQVILPGVVRRSALDLVKQRLQDEDGYRCKEKLEVVERTFTIGEIEQAWKEGRLMEAFVSGTAVSFFSYLLLFLTILAQKFPPGPKSGQIELLTFTSGRSRGSVRYLGFYAAPDKQLH